MENVILLPVCLRPLLSAFHALPLTFFFFLNECTIASCLQAPERNSDTQTFVCIFYDITQAKLVKFKQLLFLARPDSNLLVGAWQSESMDQPASSTGQPAPLDPV